MPIRFDTVAFTIPSGTGVRTFVQNAVFPSNVIRAGSALNLVDMEYTGGADRNMGRVLVDLDITNIAGPVVEVTAHCQFRDSSGNDPYEGSVSALVIADTV